MAHNFNAVIDHLLINEGGYVNHPLDRGGATIHGVTLRNWRAYTGDKVSKSRFKALQHVDVKPFYKSEYWDKVNADKLPSGVDYYVFDFAVNSGVSRSAKFLQKLVGVYPDGVIGDITIKAVNDYILVSSAVELLKNLDEARRYFLQGLPTFSTFGRGWENRLTKVMHKCKEIIRNDTGKEPVIVDKRRPLEQSKTIKAAKSQAKVSAVSATGFVSVTDFKEPVKIITDLSDATTVLSGLGEIGKYLIAFSFVALTLYSFYIMYRRKSDHFTGVNG